jgi:hypothetical protein
MDNDTDGVPRPGQLELSLAIFRNPASQKR